MVEDGYEFFAKRQLVTLFSAPNYCGEFDNAGAMMSVDETLMCSFQVNVWAVLLLITCLSLLVLHCGHSLKLTVAVCCQFVSANVHLVNLLSA